MYMENHLKPGQFMPIFTWNIGNGPKEYGIYKMSKPRKN